MKLHSGGEKHWQHFNATTTLHDNTTQHTGKFDMEQLHILSAMILMPS